MLKRLPAIVSDIDGVLQRGLSAFPFTQSSIQHIQKLGIPFSLLTNGGGQTESQRIQILNQRFNTHLNEDQIILCHTPFKNIDTYKKEYVLIGGQGNLVDIAKSYNYEKFITVKELHSLLPNLNPLAHPSLFNCQKQQLLDRFSMTEEELKNDLAFKAVMIWTDVELFELHLQLCSDLMISDGKIGNEVIPVEQQQVDLFFSQSDLIFPCEISMPRLGGGCFSQCLSLIFDKQFGKKLQFEQYGKPSAKQFLFTENVIQSQFQKIIQNQSQSSISSNNTNHAQEIGTIYMIGDNIESDIQGVNNIKKHQSSYNWKSILVKTGIYQDGKDTNNADYIVDNFQDAINLICSLENLPKMQ